MRGDVITVFGGSGFIGRYVTRSLAKAGARIRVATRRPHLALDLKVTGDVGQVQLAQANIRDRASVERAVEGADAVVNLVGVLFEAGRQRFASVHAQGAQTIAEAAAAAGASRFIHVSAIGADAGSSALYARTKAEGEARVREACPNATILRPSIVFGEEDAFFNRFAAMARFAPGLPLIGGGRTRFQPVFVGDVASAVTAALADPTAAGRVFELGGPRVYTFKELMAYILAEIDRKRLLLPMPFVLAGAVGLAGETFGALPFAKPFLTRDQVKLLKTDNVVADDAAALSDLGIEPRSVESVVPAYLERYRKYGQFHERAPEVED